MKKEHNAWFYWFVAFAIVCFASMSLGVFVHHMKRNACIDKWASVQCASLHGQGY